MKMTITAIALLFAPVAAFAQSDSGTALAGPHIGIDIVRDSLETKQPTSAREARRAGFGGRAYAGYDTVVGNIALVGAEIGIGAGSRTVSQPSLGGGRFSVNPGITYDATARLGIAPGGTFAVYGRAGYRWLRTEQAIAGQATGNVSRKLTEKGITYGGGAEVALSQNLSLRAEYNRTKFSDTLRQSKISIGASIRF